MLLHTSRTANRRSGWSLVELLVVLTIISILGFMALPVMRSFGRNDMRDGARSVYTLLRTARMHAMANNVETAVVYELDADFLAEFPLYDSLRDMPVRAIRAAQVMRRLPDDVGLTPVKPPGVDANEVVEVGGRGVFVPLQNSAGQRTEFPGGYALLLERPAREYDPAGPPTLVYLADREGVNLFGRLQGDPLAARYLANYHVRLEEPDTRDNNPFTSPPSALPGLEHLGMTPVHVYLGPLQDDFEPEELEEARYTVHPRIAHVFGPQGNLISMQSAERYTLFFGPSPDAYITDRLWFVGSEPTDEQLYRWLNRDWGAVPRKEMGLIGIPIHLNRATGRATMGAM